MSESTQQPTRSHTDHRHSHVHRNNARRGRALTAAAALIAGLATAGLLAGCGSHSPSTSASTTTVKRSAAAATSNPATPASTATPATTPTTGATTSATPAPTDTAGDGTQLGSYSFVLTDGYQAPLGPNAPTQSQMLEVNAGGAYDLAYDGDLGAGSNEKMISLPDGATPTYSACTTGTTFISSATPDKGTAFCILETNGQVAGVVVAGVGSTPTTTASVNVTIWKYVS